MQKSRASIASKGEILSYRSMYKPEKDGPYLQESTAFNNSLLSHCFNAVKVLNTHCSYKISYRFHPEKKWATA